MIFKQLFDNESSTFTYLLANEQTKEAILIDPVLEQVDRDLKLIKELDLTLVLMLNTHCHADHITGTGKLKSLVNTAKSAISRASKAKADVFLEKDQILDFGDFKIHCKATPGHTLGCLSFYVPSSKTSGSGSPGMIFTGDALLIRGCGRTDFQGGSSETLYDSVHTQIFTLPDNTLVYPAHDYKGFSVSTVAEEKKWNPRLTKTKQEFAELMAGLGLAYPKKIDEAVPANLNCGLEPEGNKL